MVKIFTSLEKLSDSFDPKAAAFCDKVKELAQKEDLEIFIVAYNKETNNGSSYTSPINKKETNHPVTNARLAHEEWEVKNGINPNHKR